MLPPHIPADVCGDIFLHLPVKSLIRFRAVCKSWRAVIDNPRFVKTYTDKQLPSNTLLIQNSTDFSPLYSFDLDALDFNVEGLQTISATRIDLTPTGFSRLPVAECNGLFLEQPGGVWEIWNPLTDEHLKLPDGDFVSPVVVVAWGLGYDPASEDYKSVVIQKIPVEELPDEYRTYVYSLKSDSWRKGAMDCPCDDYSYWYSHSKTGVYLSGALHWMPQNDSIIALYLGTEKYRQFRLPPFQKSHGDNELVFGQYLLAVLGGRLMVCDYGMDGYGRKHYDVWVMEDCGVEDSWIKLLSMTSDLCGLHDPIINGYLWPVACLKNKTQIFMQGNYGFYLFDVKSLSVKVVKIDDGLTCAQIFHGSIFRLHDNCGGVSRRVKTQRTRGVSKISDHAELYFSVGEPNYNSSSEEEEDSSDERNDSET